MDGRRADIRCAGAGIVAIAPRLDLAAGEAVMEAEGGLVLPALHDHHIHLLALAAALSSVNCGAAGADLRARLRAAAGGGRWVRAVNYHEGMAGEIDRWWLDAAVSDVPVRVQHRSGRLWILNSAGLAAVGAEVVDTPFERVGGVLTGRVYDGDGWLRGRLRDGVPNLGEVSGLLASCGISAVTDATPANTRVEAGIFAAAQARGELVQRVALMGTLDLAGLARWERLFPMALKVHLHEGDYPAPEDFLRDVRAARAAGLGVAVHCVTAGDLVFAVSLLQEAGLARGARIEHASVVPAGCVAWLAEAGVTVVTQPHFVAERGDAYVRDVPASAHADLYRCASLMQAGVPCGGGSDAPFGGWNPWRAMQAAVARRIGSGAVLGGEERMTPEAALGLYTGRLEDPGGAGRRVAVGEAAELCVLTQPWRLAREDLAGVTVRATMRAGEVIFGDTEQQGRKVA
jgi:predicted amidohydrolase YtcJ